MQFFLGALEFWLTRPPVNLGGQARLSILADRPACHTFGRWGELASGKSPCILGIFGLRLPSFDIRYELRHR